VELIGLLRPRVAIPVHYEGWSHFREPVAELEDAFRHAAPEIRDRVRWLTHGVAQTIEAPA